MPPDKTKTETNSGQISSHDDTLKEISQELWEELYFKKQEGWLTLLSGSMYPLMPVNAKILVKPVPLGNISLGDIIVFKQQNRIISHWVIGTRQENNKLLFLQQGSIFSSPAFIDGEAVFGKVFAVRYDGGYISLDTGWRRLHSFMTAICLRIKYEFFRIMHISR